MDKELLREIVKDFEKVSVILNKRLPQLYKLLGEEVPNTKSYVKESIENQRQEMMDQVEEMRKQAIAQVQKSLSSQNMMPQFGSMPSMPYGDIASLKETLMKKIKSGEKDG